MGFFSAVKKFFGSKDADQEKKSVTSEERQEEKQEGAVAQSPDVARAPCEAAQAAAGLPEAGTAECAQMAESPAFGEMPSSAETRDAAISAPAPENMAKPAQEESQPEAESVATRSQPDIADQEFLERLRLEEPRLSAWLGVVLEGQVEVTDAFWHRLELFLRALEAPDAEIASFLKDFRAWLQAMEYKHIEDFRSELQYRLALALDLEDEEDERNRFLLKLSQGLAVTREQLGRQLDSLFASHGELNPEFWADLEEMFIMADMGYEASLEIVERLKRSAARQNRKEASDVRDLLFTELDEIFRQQPRIRTGAKPEVILMMGVNGAGKTTTIAKLAHRERMAGKKVLIVAADTFRAAAIEQLEVWARRAGAEFYARAAGSDPASVAWEAMDFALANDIDTVFVDTAGRLQTRVNLMEELGKIRQVLGKKMAGAPHRNMLVLDATTGQNALSQAKLFKEAVGADEIVLTKLDGTAKGGVAIAVAMQEKLPITYVGLGEKMEDLRPFNGHDFANALLEPGAAA